MQTNFHPSPGLGDLLPGWFVVPQNPVRPDSTVLVPSVQASMPGQIARKSHMGEFLPATFSVPQNPILRNLATGMGGLACGCGTPTCNGAPNYYGMSGFDPLAGDFSSVTDWAKANSPIGGIPNWALWGGAAAVAWIVFMPGGKEYRSEKRALASRYRGYRRAAGRLAA